jgi:hypothetical protein
MPLGLRNVLSLQRYALRMTLDLVVEARFDCGDNCHW